MKRTVSLSEFMPYGAPELLAARRPHMIWALTATSFTAMLIFLVALRLAPLLQIPVELRPLVPDTWGHDVAPPPAENQPPPIAGPRIAQTTHDPAVPVPVPDVIAPPSNEPPIAGASDERGFGSGPDVSGPPSDQSGSSVEPMPVLGAWNPVDELPVAITEFKPEYPDLARQAGVEGLVIIHALIGKDGRVLRVELDEKHSSPLLNETALEAARRWAFKPAIASGHPVLFWEVIPFHFVLHE